MRQLKITQSITSRESKALDTYLVDIGRESLISIEEEIELPPLIRQGNTMAMKKLVCANLRFVVSVAKQYQNQGLPLTDLISEGNIGLIKAAEKFDETRGFKFISYAVWWIRQSILQALAENAKTVRLPLNQHGILNKISKVTAKFEQCHGRKPSIEELSEETGVPVNNLLETLKAGGKSMSIDAPFRENEEGSLLDVLINNDTLDTDDILMRESLSHDINHILSSLHERESDIIKSFFGIGCKVKTLDEIGDNFGLTRERVRQIKEKAIRKLKRNDRSNILKSYLNL